MRTIYEVRNGLKAAALNHVRDRSNLDPMFYLSNESVNFNEK